MLKSVFVLVMLIVGVVAVLTVRRNGINTMNFYLYVRIPAAIVSALFAVGSAVWHFVNKKSGKDESERVVTTTSLTAIFAICALTLVSYGFVGIDYDTMRIVALIVLAVLYFVYHVYDRVFFTISLQCAVAAFVVEILKNDSLATSLRAVVAIAALLACTLGAYAYLRCANGKSSDGVGGIKLYVMSAVTIAGILLSFFIPALTLYALFALLAVYVVLAVIFTIEMM